MPRIAKVNTYTRIINASLALFNEEGERNISTNHIAAHLGISRVTSTTISATRTKSSSNCSSVTAKPCLPTSTKPCCRLMWKTPSTTWPALRRHVGIPFPVQRRQHPACAQFRLLGRTQQFHPSQSLAALGQPALPAQRPQHYPRRPDCHE